MKERKLYTCEICLTDYADKRKAIDCEKNHKDTFEITHMKFYPKGVDNTGYPCSITIKGKDGRELVYKRR